ncbi:unnamed protein product [Cunninghamella blakesleeana]
MRDSVLSIKNLLCDDESNELTTSPNSSTLSLSTVSSPRTPPKTSFHMSSPIFSDKLPTLNHHSSSHDTFSYYQQHEPSHSHQQQQHHHHCCSNASTMTSPITSHSPHKTFQRHHPYLTSPPPHNNYITINSDLICAHYLPLHNYSSVKAKRKRASPTQIMILEHVYEHTAFPSTALREELGEKLGMEPRAVQIWFQNKRQATKRA